MSKYTVTLHQLIEGGSFDIGLQDYPIFSESYRPLLNSKIVEHFRFCEIGSETPAMFKYYINRTMNEIMPFYNDLYKTTLLDFEPLTNYKYKDETLQNENQTTQAQNESSSKHNSSNIQTNKNQSDNEYGGEDTLTQNSTNESKKTGSDINEIKSNIEDITNSTQKQINSDKTEDRTRTSDTPQDMLDKDFMNDNTYLNQATNKYSDKKTDSELSNNGKNTSTNNSTNSTNYNSQVNDVEDLNATTKKSGTDTVKQFGEQLNSNISDIIGKIVDDVLTKKQGETLKTLSGYMGVSPSVLLQEYRDTIINIDMEICNDLESCFMQIF